MEALSVQRFAFSLFVVGVLLLALPTAALADKPLPVQVVTVQGTVTAGGHQVTTSGSQFTAVAAGSPMDVAPGASAQLLLHGGSLSVGVLGHAQLILGVAKTDVQVTRLDGAVRMAGAGGALTVQGWRVELDQAGASVLLHKGCLYVLGGTALLRMPPVKVITPPPAPAPAPDQPAIAAPPPAPILPTTTTLAAGKSMPLGLKIVPATAGARPPLEVLRGTASHGTPAPWTPALAKVSKDDVKAARVWMQAETQAQRETAACGCTDGGGAQGGSLGGAGVETGNVQKTVTVIKIRIDGVPKKGK